MIGEKKLYVLLAGMIIAWIFPHKNRFKQIIFFICFVIIPLTLIILVDIKSQYWFLQRQFIWIMALFAFYLGWCWDSVILYLLKRE